MSDEHVWDPAETEAFTQLDTLSTALSQAVQVPGLESEGV